MSDKISDLRDHAGALLHAIGRLSDTLSSAVAEQKTRATAIYRGELRRMAEVFGLTVLATFLLCAAISFAAFAAMVAFWASHSVLTPALIAAALLLTATATIAVVARRTRRPE